MKLIKVLFLALLFGYCSHKLCAQSKIVGVNYSFVSSNDILKHGFGFEGNFTFPVYEKLNLRTSVGYKSNTHKTVFYEDYMTLSFECNVLIYDYYKNLDSYFSIGLGYYHSWTNEESYTTTLPSGEQITGESKFNDKISFNFKAGANYYFIENFGLNIELTYISLKQNRHSYTPYPEKPFERNSIINLSNFQLKLGMIYRLD